LESVQDQVTQQIIKWLFFRKNEILNIIHYSIVLEVYPSI